MDGQINAFVAGYNYRTNWAMNFKQNHLIPYSENFATKFDLFGSYVDVEISKF